MADRAGGKPAGKGIQAAFDEVRFGDARTLNLRASLPTVDEAVRRAEIWLRERQLQGTDEVLLITGRGKSSVGGVSPVREGVIRLFHSLRRRGVIDSYGEHTPGSFVVRLASVQALVDAPRRQRYPQQADPAPPPTPASLKDLSPETRILLRNLAERALEGLGIKDTHKFLEPEMLKQFGAIAASIPAGPDREQHLERALRIALDQHE